MAGSLLILLDDIATILDDVSVLTKVAAKKTAGVLGDDLALNAQQVTGVLANRELPVVWAVAKGSLLNKAILVPAALAINALAPWAVTPLLMAGGAFLCYEGAEKLAHKFLHPEAAHASDATHAEAQSAARVSALSEPDADGVAAEREKIKGAVRTDFILSAEIIVITLGVVATAPFWTQVSVLVAVAIAMTFGVYGLVAGIVKLDDVGLYLSQRGQPAPRAVGRALLVFAPWLMKALSVVGTAAMFLVGGGIILHGVGALHPLVEWAHAHAGGVGDVLLNGVAGLVVGALVLALVTAVQRLRGRA